MEKKKLNEKTLVSLEIKYSKPTGRSKGTKKQINYKKLFNNGYYDSQYGVCFPITLVSYLRNYYSVGKYRVTFDENIKFQSLNSKNFRRKISKVDDIIAEVKYNNIDNFSDIEKEFPHKNTRFSKYCKSIESLFDLNIN